MSQVKIIDSEVERKCETCGSPFTPDNDRTVCYSCTDDSWDDHYDDGDDE